MTLIELAHFHAQSLGGLTQALWVISELTGLDRAHIFVSNELVDETLELRVTEFIDRYNSGEPLQYLLGHWQFCELDLLCDSRALIPRPETELLVQGVFDRMNKRSDLCGVDLGTGTGAIGLSLATSAAFSKIYLTDYSFDALSLAYANFWRNKHLIKGQVVFCQGSWFDALPGFGCGGLDLVVSNPPYVPTQDIAMLDKKMFAEPCIALDGGPTGTNSNMEILEKARGWLKVGALVAIEMGESHGQFLCQAARDFGYGGVDLVNDLSGRNRYLFATML